MKRQYFINVIEIVCIALLYFFAARFGLELQAVNGFATLIWLPTGLSLAALLLFGYRLWPGLLIGAFLVNLYTQAPPLVALGIGIGNTLEGLIALFFLKRVRFNTMFNHLQDISALIIIAALFSTMVSATIGVASLYFGHLITVPEIPITWISWWMGDALSDLFVAPFLLIWTVRKITHFNVKRILESAVLFALLTIISFVVFRGLFNISIKNSPLTYLVFPPLIWIAMRFGQRETVTATALLSIVAIWGTLQGIGPFVRDTINESLLYLQSFMGIVSLTMLLLSVIVEERKDLEHQKDNFLAVASHELKTPVTSLKVFNQLLQKEIGQNENKTVTNLLSKINSQVNKLTHLIEDLLDVTKIDESKQRFQKEVFNVNVLVRETIIEMQKTTSKHSLTKVGTVKKKVYADKKRIRQVITNLLSNAIKYSPNANKIIVTVKDTPHSAQICIRDFGIGIAAGEQQRIFERFYRENGPSAYTFPGLGLGLYIASEIIKITGGTIWLKSRKGKGSTFCFSIPYK